MGSVACCGMREGISIEVSAADRDRLERIVADRNSPQKHVWRARIILATAAGLRHGGDHAPGRGVQALRLALAGAVHARRRGRAGARQDPQARAAALAAGRGRSGGRADARRSARRDDALDRPRDGGGQRRIAALGAADLGGARPPAAPGAALQAVHRPGVRGQAARRGRPLSRSAGAQPRALGRREVPDPGARPDAAGAADEEGPGRHHDPRLHPPRHDDPVRGAERARRQRHRPVHGAPPAPGVHPLPQSASRPPCRPAS